MSMPDHVRSRRPAQADGPGPIRITASPAALSQLRAALSGRPAGQAIRLFVGGGAHPQVGMSVDAPGPRDEVVDVEGVPVAVDNGSRPFLDEARIDYVSTASGAGFRVTGPNAPAPPEPAPEVADAAPSSAGPASGTEAAARAALKKVYDPEIPMNIVDLGLVYELAVDTAGKARVRFTMTSPGCPVADQLVNEVRSAVESVPGVTGAEVEVVWEPPWGPDRMSAFAKRQLGFA
ncbi:MAG TPA: iron-sulfur cluster assembly protein [Thermoplasmata archaeon]|nr:iron-sulfur cluster assembly protein [Thermoplasmata archaeon]